MLQQEGILAVPGAGFGRGGYMRLSITIPKSDMERSLPGFERAIRAAAVTTRVRVAATVRER